MLKAEFNSAFTLADVCLCYVSIALNPTLVGVAALLHCNRVFVIRGINQKTDEFQKLEFWTELPVSFLPQEYGSRKDIHPACFENLAEDYSSCLGSESMVAG